MENKNNQFKPYDRVLVFEGTFAQQGWQCPICKRVYSPTTLMCLYCGNYEETTTTTTTIVNEKLNGNQD